MMERILDFAQEHGYDSVVRVGKWRGYDIYEPVFDNDKVNIVGIPLMIIADGDNIRMTTVDEAFEYLDGVE